MNRWNKIVANKWTEIGEEPSEGHFNRFREKLQARDKKKRVNLFILRAAAVVVLIFLAAGIYTRYSPVAEVKQTASTDSEISEAGFYYTSQINSGLKEIERLVKEGAGSEKDILEVKDELLGMDSQFVSLNVDFQSNPGNERVRKAVIEYYQAKLEIVSIIKRELENVKQQKNSYHESVKI